jgi:hypothetical protein
MNKGLFLFLAATLLAAPVLAASQGDDGLVSRKSRNLDQVRTAASWPGGYRAVHIPPIEVEFQKFGDANTIQRPGTRPSTADVKRASQEMAQTLRAALQGALQKAGYEIAPSPGPGVLVLKTSLEHVRVNAPDKGAYAGAGQKSFVTEAGEASLRIEGFDGASGAKVLAIDDRARPRANMPGVDRANSVTNRFWFQDAFDHWADSVVRELPAPGRSG